MQYPYDSRQIANWFIRRAERDERSMSIMQILKLVYMAHGWTLAVLDRPLILDRIEAWEYGPVIPAVYHAFRPQGIYNLSPFHMHEREIEPEIDELLEEVYDLYKESSAGQLSRLTHVKGGPWHQTYGRGNRYREIPDHLIAAHYKDKMQRVQNG